MLYGHRNDAAGYGAALEAFDRELGRLLPKLARCRHAGHHRRPRLRSRLSRAPTTPGNTCRCWSTARACRRAPLGVRAAFADVGASILEIFGVEA